MWLKPPTRIPLVVADFRGWISWARQSWCWRRTWGITTYTCNGNLRKQITKDYHGQTLVDFSPFVTFVHPWFNTDRVYRWEVSEPLSLMPGRFWGGPQRLFLWLLGSFWPFWGCQAVVVYDLLRPAEACRPQGTASHARDPSSFAQQVPQAPSWNLLTVAQAQVGIQASCFWNMCGAQKIKASFQEHSRTANGTVHIDPMQWVLGCAWTCLDGPDEWWKMMASRWGWSTTSP